MVMDLSHSMSLRVQDWRRLHRLDERLLNECGYYPRGGCQDCSWDSPSPDCKYSHILIDTRCGGKSVIQQVKLKQKKRGGDGSKVWGVSVESLLKSLPAMAREEVMRILNESGRGGR